MSTSSTEAPGELLLHPTALSAAALLWLNDHVLKAAYPCWLTGKLSDFAGLMMFPLLLVSLLELASAAVRVRFRAHARAVGVAALLTGLVFSSIKLHTGAADAYRAFFGWRWQTERALLGRRPAIIQVQHAMDASDLIALPALLVPITLARRRRSGARGLVTGSEAE